MLFNCYSTDRKAFNMKKYASFILSYTFFPGMSLEKKETWKETKETIFHCLQMILSDCWSTLNICGLFILSIHFHSSLHLFITFTKEENQVLKLLTVCVLWIFCKILFYCCLFIMIWSNFLFLFPCHLWYQKVLLVSMMELMLFPY